MGGLTAQEQQQAASEAVGTRSAARRVPSGLVYGDPAPRLLPCLWRFAAPPHFPLGGWVRATEREPASAWLLRSVGWVAGRREAGSVGEAWLL